MWVQFCAVKKVLVIMNSKLTLWPGLTLWRCPIRSSACKRLGCRLSGRLFCRNVRTCSRRPRPSRGIRRQMWQMLANNSCNCIWWGALGGMECKRPRRLLRIQELVLKQGQGQEQERGLLLGGWCFQLFALFGS